MPSILRASAIRTRIDDDFFRRVPVFSDLRFFCFNGADRSGSCSDLASAMMTCPRSTDLRPRRDTRIDEPDISSNGAGRADSRPR